MGKYVFRIQILNSKETILKGTVSVTSIDLPYKDGIARFRKELLKALY